MKVSYKKLWDMLAEREMSQAELRKAAGIAPATFTKLRRNQEVALSVLLKIADVLDCDIGEMMCFAKDTDLPDGSRVEEYFVNPAKSSCPTYEKTTACDVEPIYRLCKQLIDDYEDMDSIDYDKVLKWVRRKIEISIDEYTAVFVSGEKVGYYHFYQNEDGEYELDDLYIFPQYQNRGIGSAVIQACAASVKAPVMLYVFIKNEKAVALYKRLGFEIIRTVNGSRYVMRKETGNCRQKHIFVI